MEEEKEKKRRNYLAELGRREVEIWDRVNEWVATVRTIGPSGADLWRTIALQRLSLLASALAGRIDARGIAHNTAAMAPEQQASQAGNLDRRAAQKRTARNEDRRLEAGESPVILQAENSVVPAGSLVGARISNLWQAMGK